MEVIMSNDNELDFNNLEHSDDWPDATVREPELEPDEEGKKYLAELEAHLNAAYDSEEVQAYVRKQQQE